MQGICTVYSWQKSCQNGICTESIYFILHVHVRPHSYILSIFWQQGVIDMNMKMKYTDKNSVDAVEDKAILVISLHSTYKTFISWSHMTNIDMFGITNDTCNFHLGVCVSLVKKTAIVTLRPGVQSTNTAWKKRQFSFNHMCRTNSLWLVN